MRALFVTLVPVAIVVACARERPPPRVCEVAPPPSKTKKDVRIGTCPIDWGHDAGIDAPQEVSVDAPRDG